MGLLRRLSKNNADSTPIIKSRVIFFVQNFTEEILT